MLKPAGLYEDELKLLDMEVCYGNMKYQYYYGDPFYSTLNITGDNGGCEGYHFVSVDEKDNILGYIGYSVDPVSKTAKYWGAKSYKTSIIFAQDCLKVIDDVFCKFNLNRIEWFCYADNPATRGYDKLVEKYGGTRAGYLHKERMLADGELHDTIIYEIMRENYLKAKRGE